MSAGEGLQVLFRPTASIDDVIRASFQIEDYTFEERYCRGVERVPRPKQDEVSYCMVIFMLNDLFLSYLEFI